MKLHKWLGLASAVALAFGATQIARAADDYPTRPIQIICPSAPGGGSDTLARLIARELEKVSGKPVIVINRAGGGGLIGTRSLISAKPDGYTLYIHASTAVVGNAYLVKDAGYDPLKDMVAVAPVSRIGWAVVVGSKSPVQSIADLTKLLKEKNGKATYASPNNATVAATELYSEMVGAKSVRVNFKAVTAAIADVAAGEIDFTFADIALAVPQSNAGRVRVLAVTTPERANVDKSFPTMVEAGVPGYEYTSFFGMWAPAGTPQPIVDKLGGWMQKIIGDQEVQQAIVRSGFDPLPGTSKDLTQLVTEDSKRWAELVKAGKLQVE